MTRLPSLACTAAALLLTFGLAVAAEQAEAEPAKPATANNPENPSQAKEETAAPSPSQGKTAKTDKEPECE